MDWQYHIILVFLGVLLTQCSNHVVRCVITDVRLVGGPTSNKGTVEISVDNGTWETTCGTNLDTVDVIVICRHLGFKGASRAIHDTPYGPYPSPTRGLGCTGDETDLSECPLQVFTNCPNAGGASCHGESYIGCFVDVSTARVFSGDSYIETHMTINACIQLCSGSTMAHYKYAGVEHGNECYCGEARDNYTRHGLVVSDKNCQNLCSASATESCGGLGYIAVFSLSMVTESTVSSPISLTSIVLTTSTSSLELTSPDQVTKTNYGNKHATSSPSTKYIAPPTTSALPLTGNNTGLYAGIGGGVAAFIILLIIIVIIFIMGRRSRKRRKDTVQNNNGRLSVDYTMPDKNGNEPRNDYEGITNEMAPYASVDNVNPMRPRTMPNMNDRLSVVYAAPDKNGKGPRNDTSEDCGSLYAIPDKPRGQPDGNDDGIVHGLYAKADESSSGDQYEPDMVENELYTI